jgi:glycosyltransferase involved in cell wall biosynthesis
MALVTRLVVVIPTKNSRALVERAIESVRSQDYDAYRIVVVNDGSTDTTQEFLDSLRFEPSKLQVIKHEKSRGVNAARNAAFKTLTEGEWAVQLDDDDMFLPHALEIIAEGIQSSPETVQVVCFNTITRTHEGDQETGRRFELGEKYHDVSYYELMVDAKLDGDNRAVYKWTLFPKYLFSEDINGFEGTWARLAGRDDVGMRYFPGKTTLIDQSHGQEQLSMIAAKRNPGSFVRAYKDVFRDHADFYKIYPEQAVPSTISAFKLSIRSFDPFSALYFLLLYCKYHIVIAFGTKRKKEK